MKIATWSLTAATVCCVIALAIDRANSQVERRPTPVRQAAEPDRRITPPSPPEHDNVADWFAAAHAALGKKVDADFDNTSLQEFAAWLAKTAGMDVAIDRQALATVQKTADIKVTLHCKAIALRDVAAQALSPLELAIAAASVPSGLRITTVEAADHSMFTRLYDVRDLRRGRDRGGALVEDMDEIEQLITQHLHPQTWNQVGGAGNARIFADALVVSQTLQMHERVQAALDRVREVRDAQRAGDLSPRPLDPADDENLAAMAQLKKPCAVLVKDKPLGEFAELVAKELKIAIRVDDRALKDAGIERSTRISLESQHGTWEAALRTALRDADLTIVGRDGAVTITTPDAADNEQITMVYPVADLVDALSQGCDPGAGWDDLSLLIQSFVAPQSWSGATGPGDVHPCLPCQAAIIPQTYEVHEQIQSLLAQLRRHVQASPTGAPTDDPVQTAVYRLPKDVRPEAAQATAEGIAKIIRETIAPESWKASDATAVYLGVLPDRILVRHRRSVQRAVVKLLTPIDGLATSVTPP
jgi:hypothetical protein